MFASKRQNERLVALLIAGILFINYPILSLFSKPRLLFGAPVLYLYLFAVWLLFILLLAIIVGRDSNHPYSSKTTQAEETG